jgi:hypothetical protein
MGMYDTLYINPDKLPISDEEKEFIQNLKSNYDWQTKSLYSSLATYEITDEGKLFLIKAGWLEELEEEKPISPEEIPFHGYMNFYGTINKKSYIFYVKFTDGKVVDILKEDEVNEIFRR